MVIDFSAPAALPAVARYVRQTGTPLLSGVTGLSGAELEIFTDLGRAAPVLHSANYSLGIAVFRRALAEVAGVLSDFDVEIVETHHNQKADAPSGDEPVGRVERAVDKDLPGGGPVGDLQRFVGTEEAHRVGPRLGAPPEGVYADLPLVPGPGNAVGGASRTWWWRTTGATAPSPFWT